MAADIVIRIRPDAYGAEFEDLVLDIDRVLVQLARWRASVPETDTVPNPVSSSESSDT